MQSNIPKLAVLLTCHNRKEKTLKCLELMFTAVRFSKKKLNVTVYLTDDGSTDGTADAVLQKFPDTIIMQGNGNLFWANGMINSWTEALKNKFDYYLLLNDDTELFKNSLEVLFDAKEKCYSKFQQHGVYIGSTLDENSKKISYGGAVITSKLKYTFDKIIPDGEIHLCDLGNANIMLVHYSVVEKIGILSEGYAHGVADFDYTLKCKKNNIPVVVAEKFCGYCTNDHKGMYDGFDKKSLKERVKYLYSPTGIAFKSRLKYMRRFFPLRYPFFYLVGWFKVLFPKMYILTMTNR